MPWKPERSKVCLSSWDSAFKSPFLQTWFLTPPGGSKASGDCFVTAGLVAGCGSGACGDALSAPMIPGDDERSSDTKTGVRSYHNPYHQGKGESTKHLAAHQEQDEHGKECQTAGQDRSRKSLIDGLVDHVSERFLAQQTIVLTDAIEDDNRVVHGITDQSQQRRNNRERNLEMQQREEPQGDQHVMKDGQNGSGTVDPLESEGNIYQHAAQIVEGNVNRLLAEYGADLGADDFDVANGERTKRVAVFHGSENPRGDAIGFREVIKISGHAGVILVAIVEKFFSKLLIAIAGVDGEEQGILLGEDPGAPLARRALKITLVRPPHPLRRAQPRPHFF